MWGGYYMSLCHNDDNLTFAYTSYIRFMAITIVFTPNDQITWETRVTTWGVRCVEGQVSQEPLRTCGGPSQGLLTKFRSQGARRAGEEEGKSGPGPARPVSLEPVPRPIQWPAAWEGSCPGSRHMMRSQPIRTQDWRSLTNQSKCECGVKSGCPSIHLVLTVRCPFRFNVQTKHFTVNFHV